MHLNLSLLIKFKIVGEKCNLNLSSLIKFKIVGEISVSHLLSGLFGIFNILTFKQDSCTPSANNDRTGTCMTRSECENLSGEGGTVDELAILP